MSVEKRMEAEEVIKLIEIFLGDADLWPLFEKWLEEKGYTPEDLGFEE